MVIFTQVKSMIAYFQQWYAIKNKQVSRHSVGFIRHSPSHCLRRFVCFDLEILCCRFLVFHMYSLHKYCSLFSYASRLMTNHNISVVLITSDAGADRLIWCFQTYWLWRVTVTVSKFEGSLFWMNIIFILNCLDRQLYQ